MRYCVLLNAETQKAEPVKAKSGESLMKIAHRLIDCDTLPDEEIFEKLRAIDGVSRVRVIYY